VHDVPFDDKLQRQRPEPADYLTVPSRACDLLDSAEGRALASKLTPRRYENVGGHYGHPNAWVRQLVYGILSTAGSIAFGNKVTMGEINILITTLGLHAQRMPYYFVGEDFIRAVAATAIPKGVQFGELRWLRKAQPSSRDPKRGMRGILELDAKIGVGRRSQIKRHTRHRYQGGAAFGGNANASQ
jgi:hypothetical protein